MAKPYQNPGKRLPRMICRSSNEKMQGGLAQPRELDRSTVQLFLWRPVHCACVLDLRANYPRSRRAATRTRSKLPWTMAETKRQPC